MVSVTVGWKLTSWRIYGFCNLVINCKNSVSGIYEANTSFYSCLSFCFISIQKKLKKPCQYFVISGARVTNADGLHFILKCSRYSWICSRRWHCSSFICITWTKTCRKNKSLLLLNFPWIERRHFPTKHFYNMVHTFDLL